MPLTTLCEEPPSALVSLNSKIANFISEYVTAHCIVVDLACVGIGKPYCKSKCFVSRLSKRGEEINAME